MCERDLEAVDDARTRHWIGVGAWIILAAVILAWEARLRVGLGLRRHRRVAIALLTLALTRVAFTAQRPRQVIVTGEMRLSHVSLQVRGSKGARNQATQASATMVDPEGRLNRL